MTMERPPYALGARTPLALQQRKQTLELALHMSKSLCTTRNASSTMREAGVVQLLRQIMADCNGGTDADATLIAAAVCLLDVSCAPFPGTHTQPFLLNSCPHTPCPSRGSSPPSLPIPFPLLPASTLPLTTVMALTGTFER